MALTVVRSKEIRDTWEHYVFKNSAITNISPVVIYHDITEDSHKENSYIRHNQKTNFWAFDISRAPVESTLGGFRVQYLARCSYTKWADPRGQAYFDCIDAIETLQEVIVSELGNDWKEKVNGSELPLQPSFPEIQTINNEQVFTIRYNVTGLICHG